MLQPRPHDHIVYCLRERCIAFHGSAVAAQPVRIPDTTATMCVRMAQRQCNSVEVNCQCRRSHCGLVYSFKFASGGGRQHCTGSVQSRVILQFSMSLRKLTAPGRSNRMTGLGSENRSETAMQNQLLCAA